MINLSRILITVGFALSALFTAASASTATAATTVRVHDGLLRGTAQQGYRTFEGVPYAAPPVGALRWGLPEPAASWAGVRDATRPASACPQQAGEVPGGSVDEDCLYLNVTAPDGAVPAHPRPVIVWLHGGGFTTGAGSSYDAHRMAMRGDVVVVTVNYRLGVLGFLASPGLPGSGDFGLADQQAALRWVRAEIGAFGGDARNVTLAGESAGGYSVCAQLASPAAAGLFDRAIIESGPCTGSSDRPFAPSSVPLATANAVGADFAAKVGCGGDSEVVTCLRRIRDVSSLLADQGPDQQPAYGTPLLPQDPAEAVASGRFHRVPVLMGNNHDEGNGWAAGIIEAGHPVTHDTWPDVAAAFFSAPGEASAIVSEYPVRDGSGDGGGGDGSGGDGGPVLGAVIGDADFACPTARAAGLLGARVPVWRYEFADEDAPLLTSGTPPFPLGAPHASELPYLFDLGGRPRKMTAAQQRLADAMIDYWTRFAGTGDPNGASGSSGSSGSSGPSGHSSMISPAVPHWSREAVLSLAPDRIVPTHTAEVRHHCAFWKSLG